MRPRLCLLLPILNREELESFLGLSSEALLSPDNIPALTRLYRPIFCPISSTGSISRLRKSEQWKQLSEHVEISPVLIDHLLVDYTFEVLPSLAYWTALARLGKETDGDAFVFLQPNLVVGNGSLRTVARRLNAGADVLWATYLRVDHPRFSLEVPMRVKGARLSPRELVAHALTCLEYRELASVVNLRLTTPGSAGRHFWRCDASTFLAYDRTPSLVAARMSVRVGEQAPGFRDWCFAEAICPGGAVQRITDSDEFVGIEMINSTSSSAFFNVQDRGWSVEESLQPGAVELADVVRAPAVFHAGGIPRTVARERAKASDYISHLYDENLPRKSNYLEDRFWKLGIYLWSVRKFELSGGPMPSMRWNELSAPVKEDAPVAAGARNSGFTSMSRNSRFTSMLVWLIRLLRDRCFGYAPLVTWLHPEWTKFRHALPTLRKAVSVAPTERFYVADAPAMLSRILGPPDTSSEALLNVGELTPDVARPKIAIIEISSVNVTRWAELVERVLPRIRPGGQILVFYDNHGTGEAATQRAIAKGWSKLDVSQLRNFSMFVVIDNEFRRWLSGGYPIVLGYVRRRGPLAVLKGMTLFSVLSALTALYNLAVLGRGKKVSLADACTSATILIDV